MSKLPNTIEFTDTGRQRPGTWLYLRVLAPWAFGAMGNWLKKWGLTRGKSQFFHRYFNNPRCEPWCWYNWLQNWVILFRYMLGFIFQHHGAYGNSLWKAKLVICCILLWNISSIGNTTINGPCSIAFCIFTRGYSWFLMAKLGQMIHLFQFH